MKYEINPDTYRICWNQHGTDCRGYKHDSSLKGESPLSDRVKPLKAVCQKETKEIKVIYQSTHPKGLLVFIW